MKIITTTAEDFIEAEIAEWGFDYVEAKFDSGYEPTLLNGVWCWHVLRTLPPHNGFSNGTGDFVSSARCSIRLLTH